MWVTAWSWLLCFLIVGAKTPDIGHIGRTYTEVMAETALTKDQVFRFPTLLVPLLFIIDLYFVGSIIVHLLLCRCRACLQCCWTGGVLHAGSRCRWSTRSYCRMVKMTSAPLVTCTNRSRTFSPTAYFFFLSGKLAWVQWLTDWSVDNRIWSPQSNLIVDSTMMIVDSIMMAVDRTIMVVAKWRSEVATLCSSPTVLGEVMTACSRLETLDVVMLVKNFWAALKQAFEVSS